MKIRDYLFHAYYHQFLTIEADELTDKLKNRIAIHEDDCYAAFRGTFLGLLHKRS